MPIPQAKLDAAESAFLQRELTSMYVKALQRKYPELKGLALIPINTQDDDGAKTFDWYELDFTAIARYAADDNTDAPVVGINDQLTVGQFRRSIDMFKMTTEEVRNEALKSLRRAVGAGGSLGHFQRKMNGARYAIDKQMNDTAWYGDSDNGLPGLLTVANANLVVAGTATASPNGTAWSSTSGKTPDEIIADLNNLLNASIINTNSVENVDTIVLPVAAYLYIDQTPRASNSDTTILEFFLGKNQKRGVTVEMAAELNSVASPPSGGSAASVGVAFRRDPDVLEHRIPFMFRTLPPERRGYSELIHCEAKHGGVTVYRPLAVSYMESI